MVFGGERHLALAAALIRGDTREWRSPFEQSVAEILAQRGRRVCVLASGDPNHYGVGAVLAGHIEPGEVVVVPASSAFSLAAARLLWPIAQTCLLSLCGRPVDLLRPHLHPGARILALSADEATPAAVAGLLSSSGFGASRLTVMESLGGARERIRTVSATGFNLEAIARLNTLAIEVVAGPGARILPRASGLPEEMFAHDGQITKREIRALTLSALAPRRGELLWDVGAGSGSISIEWMLCDPSLRAIALEQRAERASRIRRNATAFGVPGLEVIEGTAPLALEGLAMPHAVFIGGGVSTPDLIERVQSALPPAGRLVVNAVTLDSESTLARHYARSGGQLRRFEISRAERIGGESGRMSGWRPARPVTQWCWEKP